MDKCYMVRLGENKPVLFRTVKSMCEYFVDFSKSTIYKKTFPMKYKGFDISKEKLL